MFYRVISYFGACFLFFWLEVCFISQKGHSLFASAAIAGFHAFLLLIIGLDRAVIADCLKIYRFSWPDLMVDSVWSGKQAPRDRGLLKMLLAHWFIVVSFTCRVVFLNLRMAELDSIWFKWIWVRLVIGCFLTAWSSWKWIDLVVAVLYCRQLVHDFTSLLINYMWKHLPWLFCSFCSWSDLFFLKFTFY